MESEKGRATMKTNGKTIGKAWLLLFIGISLLSMTACAPAASKAASRAQINAGAIVPESQIRVAEYLRYYDQHFPEPTDGVLGVDLRLGNEKIPVEGGLAWLQIGWQAKSAEEDIVAPLNLALVIDRSGSMSAPDKMPYVRQSLRIFLASLNPDDIVSIVTYGAGLSGAGRLCVYRFRGGDGSLLSRAGDEPQAAGCQ
jgi:hypothetical protein